MLLEESLQRPDLSNYQRSNAGSGAPANITPPVPLVTDTSFLICPLPLSFAFPDGLRQFNRAGVPNYRMISPKLTSVAFNP